jgi:hypothetical protein
MIDIIANALVAVAVAVAAFVAGWRAHRWHVLSFSRWPNRPTSMASTRRARVPFSFHAHRR